MLYTVFLQCRVGSASSLNRNCMVQVPFFPPLSRVTSQSCLQDATVATSLAEEWRESDTNKRLLKSFLRMSFLVEMAFSGSLRHCAVMSVPSGDSSILHCWTIDVLRYGYRIWSILAVFNVTERSLLRRVTFLRNIWVDMEGQRLVCGLHFLNNALAGEEYDNQFHTGKIQGLPDWN